MAKIIQLSILFLLLFLSPSISSIKVNDCETLLINNLGLFITCPWTKVPPFSVKYLTSTIQFSLGNNHVANCDNSQMIWSTMDKGLETCKDISIKDPTFELLNKRDPNQGYKTIFPSQTIGNNVYQLNVSLKCDHNVSNPLKTNFQLTKFITTPLKNTNPVLNTIDIEIEGSSSLGCPVVSLGSFYQLLANHTLFLLLIVASLGLIICFWGFEMFKSVSFILITVLATIFIGAVMISFATFGDNARGFFPALTFSLLGGIFLGLLVFKFVSFAYFTMGSLIGIVVGTVFYQAIIAPIVKDFAGTAPILIIIMFFGLIGGYIFLIFHKKVIILSTAIIGAYLFGRSVGFLFGSFPTEFSIGEGKKDWSPIFFAYLVGMIILALLGIYAQNKLTGKSPSQREFENEIPDDPEAELFLDSF